MKFILLCASACLLGAESAQAVHLRSMNDSDDPPPATLVDESEVDAMLSKMDAQKFKARYEAY